MMPSVIPARLQFECGHAALVTLPRVKGETAPQRNARVAREKSAALLRQCDFCAPANGSNHVAAQEVVETTPVLEIVVPAAEPVAEAAPEPTDEPMVEPVGGADLTEDTEARELEHESPVPFPEVGDQPRTAHASNGVASPKPVRKPRARRQPAPSPAEVARGQRFLVEYRLERVLRADSIRDALRQAARFGPAEVLGITREH